MRPPAPPPARWRTRPRDNPASVVTYDVRQGASRATINEVATGAGVSIKTVSRVMNGEPNVRRATRERVRRVATELGYEPNPQARALAGRRTFSIGLLYENPHEFGYVQRAFEGVFAACEAGRYTLLLRPCGDGSRGAGGPSAKEVLGFVTQTRVDGVILTAPLGDDKALLAALRANGTPVACIAPREADPRLCSVRARDRSASRALTEHLLSFGHRRIAFINGDPRHGASAERLAGFREGLRAAACRADERLFVDGGFDFPSGEDGARRLLGISPRPTAIAAANDEMAAGAIAAAHALGLRVPADISVVGFDDSPAASRTWPPLTTARQPVFEMAQATTADLIEQLRTAGTPRQRVFDCPLVLRGSVAAPAARKSGPAEPQHAATRSAHADS